MKPVPLLRAVTWLVFFGGGVAAGFFLKPPVQSVAAAGSAPALAVVAAPALEQAQAQFALPKVSFDGTAAGLIRVASSTTHYYRSRMQLYLVLQPLSAERIGELTVSFPWSSIMGGAERTALHVLVEQWAEKNPEAALRWAQSLPKHRSLPAVSQIVSAVAMLDAKKALALARALTPPGDRDQVLRELSTIIAEDNPQQALELLFANGYSGDNYQMVGILARWVGQDPAGAFARVRELRPSQNRQRAMQEVLSAWAQTDPAAARTAALSLPEGKPRSDCLTSIFRWWGNNDPQAAQAAAQTMTSDKERREALRSALSGWANIDPASAVEAAAALPKSAHSRTLLKETYAVWAQQDPAAAAASAAGKQLSKLDRSDVLANIASGWGQQDPQAAMAWARSLPAAEGGSAAIARVMSGFARTDGQAAAALWASLPKEHRGSNLGNLMQGWMATDEAAALRFARSLERPQDRVNALLSAVSKLDPEKPEAITSVLNDLPAGQIRVDGIRNVLSSYGRYDPDGAVRWLRTLPENERIAVFGSQTYDWEYSSADPKELRALLESTPGLSGSASYLWSSTAGSMAREDPAAALVWAQNLESPLGRRQSVYRVLETWGWEDPAAAVAQAAALKDPALAKEALPGIFQRWAQQDPDAVLAWAATASGPEREHALLQGTLAKADHDPVASAAAVESMLNAKGGEKPGAALNNAVTQVTNSFFRQDIGQATAWALQLPAGSAQEAAVSTITTNWARLDPVAASEWVQQLPQGATRDTAAQQLSYGIQYSDPESAFAWASSIANEAKREEAVRGAAGAWIWQDRNAARAAIARAPVSENVRATLLEQVEKRE